MLHKRNLKLSPKEFNEINTYYESKLLMGEYVKKTFGNKAYTIGFTAYHGMTGTCYDRKPEVLQEAPSGTFESDINELGVENAFFDFSKEPETSILNQTKQITRPLGYFFTKISLPQIMDGIIYTKNMTKVTYNDDFR